LEEVAMTRIIDTGSNSRLPARLAAGIAISALLVLGASFAAANAEETETTIETHSEYSVGPATVVAPPVIVESPAPRVMVAPPPVILESPPQPVMVAPPMVIVH